MSLFQGAGALFSIIIIFGYLNQRYLKLPDTLGMTAIGVFAAASFSILGWVVPSVAAVAQGISLKINFSELVFHGLLSPLLFASALHVDVTALRKLKIPVFMLATVGVLISTILVGLGLYFASAAIGLPLNIWFCMVFGALISPTDPIAVLAVLRNSRVPERLETKIVGESLFNDGTAVVAFVAMLGIATGATVEPGAVATSFLIEVLGGLAAGVLLGRGATAVLNSVDNSSLEILLTLVVVTAGYSIAESLHVSAPLAMVVAGLVVGYSCRHRTDGKSRKHLFTFWTLIDELLNLILFGLIALKLTALQLSLEFLLIGLVAVPVVLVARAASVALPLYALKSLRQEGAHTVSLMTWGGLRGGISIALALSLPEFEGRELVVGATYSVVVFSLLVQATSLSWLVRKLGWRL